MYIYLYLFLYTRQPPLHLHPFPSIKIQQVRPSPSTAGAVTHKPQLSSQKALARLAETPSEMSPRERPSAPASASVTIAGSFAPSVSPSCCRASAGGSSPEERTGRRITRNWSLREVVAVRVLPFGRFYSVMILLILMKTFTVGQYR